MPSHRGLNYRATFTRFFTATATTAIYTLSLHDALPIYVDPATNTKVAIDRATGTIVSAVNVGRIVPNSGSLVGDGLFQARSEEHTSELRHEWISYAVFCLKKKKSN